MALKKKQSGSDVKRIRLSVPEDDNAVIEWLSHQYSPSLSIRMLIRKAIEEGGMRDFFATDVGEVKRMPRRGRPPKDYVPTPESVAEAEPDVEDEPVMDVSVEAEPVIAGDDVSERILQMQGLLNK